MYKRAVVVQPNAEKTASPAVLGQEYIALIVMPEHEVTSKLNCTGDITNKHKVVEEAFDIFKQKDRRHEEARQSC